ncbi:hypothetical protein ACJX0J_038011, partial [Zea mays]
WTLSHYCRLFFVGVVFVLAYGQIKSWKEALAAQDYGHVQKKMLGVNYLALDKKLNCSSRTKQF